MVSAGGDGREDHKSQRVEAMRSKFQVRRLFTAARIGTLLSIDGFMLFELYQACMLLCWVSLTMLRKSLINSPS